MTAAARATILLFRHDLRLADNPALTAACARGGPVIPLYVLDDTPGEWRLGGAQRWWLHESLRSLGDSLAVRGLRLTLARGAALAELQRVLRATGADAVYWNRCYEPDSIARDQQIKESLRASGFGAESFNGSLLIEPWQVRTKAGGPFQVFTPYWRQCLAQLAPEAPLPIPQHFAAPVRWPDSLPLEALQLLPKLNWHRGFHSVWNPGEQGAHAQLARFIADALHGYEARRDLPGVDGTSRVSPHLRFGELSPRQVWHAVRDALERGLGNGPGALITPEWKLHRYITELGWREFAYHLLYHYPHTVTQPLRTQFENFPWRDDPGALRAWQQGRTGFPLVDAGMRELWHTGWMHNRVRMVAASLLVKNLGIHWLEGARWFWDTLLDADLASNTLGWQWVAGCGADAAPYFRIFNPVTQAKKFDPDGAYIRRWLPELATPSLGYPPPIIDLAASRKAALARARRVP